MKRLLPFIFLVSCTVQQGSQQTTYADGRISKKSHLYASVGSKAKGLTNSPEGSSILEVDDSVSLRNVGVTAASIYTAYGLLAGQESNNALEASNVAQAARTDRTQVVSKAAVEKAKINADVAKAALKP
jgi:hypothetical protein